MEAQIDAAVERWVEEGLVEATDWGGRPLIVTPLPAGPGVVFDPERVEKVLKAFRALRQIVGRWSEQPFVLLDWQVRWIIAPVFGLVCDGLRVIRTVWVEIPRKNGKSTLCSGLALVLAFADREPAAQVYAAAGGRDQAKLVFNPARQMALKSPELKRKLGKGIQRSIIEHPSSGAFFRAVSSRDDLAHGLNVHGAVIDEVHVHKSPDLTDALETGVGSREQPLVVFITTADDGSDGSVYATKREYLEGCSSGSVVDESFYGLVFGADKDVAGFDPFAEETLRAANPGYGVTVMADYLARKAKEAKQSPALLNRYLRLHLNVRTKQTFRWLDLARWDATAGLVTDELFRGQTLWSGLDLSTTTDFTAACFLAKQPDDGYVGRWLFWLPEDRIAPLEKQLGVPLRQWVNQGFIHTTEGNVVDYVQVRRDFTAETERLGKVGAKVAEVVYDPWNATETVQRLEEAGFQCVPLRQGYASLSAPSKELERLVMGSTPAAPLFIHGGNPVLRWMADNVEAMSDPGGNIKPAKPDRNKSSKRIDGIACAVNALARAMVHKPRKRRKAVGFG